MTQPDDRRNPTAVERVSADEREIDMLALWQANALLCQQIAYHVTRDHHLAQDAAQMAFVDLWLQSRRRQTPSDVRGWLITLSHRRAVDVVRREQSQRDRRERAASDQIDRAIASGDQRLPDVLALAELDSTELREALGKLRPNQREPLFLSYFLGLSHAEIAVHTGAPLGTVKTRILSGIVALRKQFDS
jgi:RNA polymerase sigma-70 factor (ECF subfamily)